MIIGYSPGADGLDAAATAPANLRNLGFNSTPGTDEWQAHAICRISN